MFIVKLMTSEMKLLAIFKGFYFFYFFKAEDLLVVAKLGPASLRHTELANKLSPSLSLLGPLDNFRQKQRRKKMR